MAHEAVNKKDSKCKASRLTVRIYAFPYLWHRSWLIATAFNLHAVVDKYSNEDELMALQPALTTTLC